MPCRYWQGLSLSPVWKFIYFVILQAPVCHDNRDWQRNSRQEKQERPHYQNAHSDAKHKRNREKRRASLVSRIFKFLRFHFYPSAIATVATKCGKCDEREVARQGNVRALLSLVNVTSACLLSVPRVMAFVSAAVTFINRGLPLWTGTLTTPFHSCEPCGCSPAARPKIKLKHSDSPPSSSYFNSGVVVNKDAVCTWYDKAITSHSSRYACVNSFRLLHSLSLHFLASIVTSNSVDSYGISVNILLGPLNFLPFLAFAVTNNH